MTKSKAFSLLEILVVTFIVTSAFMGIMALVRQIIVVRSASKDSFLARVVAQEGIELVRYLRNENWQANKDFSLTLTNDEFHTDGTSTILMLNTKIKDGSISTNRNKIPFWFLGSDKFGFAPANTANSYVKDKRTAVYLCEEAGGKFYYSQAITNNNADLTFPPAGCAPTKFRRVIETIYRTNATATTTDDSLEVRSIVHWSERGSDKYFILDTLLTDYAQKY